MKEFSITKNISIGRKLPLLIAGPCAIENEKTPFQTAEALKKLSETLKVPFVFKASYDKANRTSGNSFRGIGMKKGLDVLKKIKKDLQLPILTDIHQVSEIKEVAEVADIIQIPAFLCRQTDLLKEAAKTKLTVNIKKGQFMSPDDMQYAVEKITGEKNQKVFVTERGTSFGYHNLVVDMRGLAIMRKNTPVIFDLTHSVQIPGGLKGKSGGAKEFIPTLGRAAAAAGVDGFFIETHPNPNEALSDGPNMIPLNEMENILKQLLDVWFLVKAKNYA
jgi:2-dehydro-3-deoxyphosphooctonate aldolase (KDO 8-P synthase)